MTEMFPEVLTLVLRFITGLGTHREQTFKDTLLFKLIVQFENNISYVMRCYVTISWTLTM